MTAADCAGFEALLDSIQTTVHAVAEGQVALIERLDRIEVRFDRLEGRIEQVSIQLAAIDAKLTAIDTKLDTFSVDTQSGSSASRRTSDSAGPRVRETARCAAP